MAPVNVYGPMEAGFFANSAPPGMDCLTSDVPGGVDTNLATAMVAFICGSSVTVLDEYGGHANPYHYHEPKALLWDEDSVTKHSTRWATAGLPPDHVDWGLVRACARTHLVSLLSLLALRSLCSLLSSLT